MQAEAGDQERRRKVRDIIKRTLDRRTLAALSATPICTLV